MIWLRLNRAQVALASMAVALLIGAIAALLLPAPALPRSPNATTVAESRISFEAPLPAIANDPASPLVERNPFNAARQPPEQRRTATSAAEAAALLEAAQQPVNLVLMGTVVTGTGRNIAVIKGDPASPTGANYHVGDEPLPGYRITRITRDQVTILGNGRNLELTVQKDVPPIPGYEEGEQ